MLKLTFITLGNKMPGWIADGCAEYSKRLSQAFQVKLIEIPLEQRGKASDLSRIIDKEAAAVIHALPANGYHIALTIEGKTHSSEQLAGKLEQLQMHQQHLTFIIGGPEGLSPEVLARCHEQWSLSALTLPHPLVRVVLLEALYRAWSITVNHPYHK